MTQSTNRKIVIAIAIIAAIAAIAAITICNADDNHGDFADIWKEQIVVNEDGIIVGYNMMPRPTVTDWSNIDMEFPNK